MKNINAKINAKDILCILVVVGIIGVTAATAVPVTTLQLSGTAGLNGWNTSDVTVTLTVTDNSGSGISYTKYRINSGAWIDYSGPFIISNEGINTLDYYSVDNAGSEELSNTIQIKIDKNSPIITAPSSKIAEASIGLNWGSYFRYPSTMKPELDKFSNLLGVYSGHVHYTSNQTIKSPYGNKVLYSTINGLENTIIGTRVVTPSDEVGYTTIGSSSSSNDLSYDLVLYNTTDNLATPARQLKFITVGDPHTHSDDPDGRDERLMQVVDFIDRSDVDFAVFLGDMTGGAMTAEFVKSKSILSRLTKPYYVVVGGHDVRSAITIEYCNTPYNWVTSDPINTLIAGDNITKQEDMGSLRITTNSYSTGNTIIATEPPKDLTGFDFIDFWIMSDTAGSGNIKAGFGENSIVENELPITINQANVWQKVAWNINSVPDINKNNITKFGLTILGNQPMTIHIDNIVGANDHIFETYFGPQAHIENVNGYQLLFIGTWKDHVNVTTGGVENAVQVDHWDFDFSDPNIDKTKPTLVFVHGALYNTPTPVSLGIPMVSDNIDPSPLVVNDAPIEGFQQGISTVTWSAIDIAGNRATGTQLVNITDTKKPTIAAPTNITREATGNGIRTLVDLGEAIVSDIVDPNPIVTNNMPLNGFPLGTTKVVWTAKDYSGNKQIDNEWVTIVDTSAPNTVATLSGTAGTNGWYTSDVQVTLTAIDSGVGVASTTYIMGGTGGVGGTYSVPILVGTEGITSISYYSTDNLGHVELTKTTDIKIDKTIPTITAPSDVSVEATGTLTNVNLGNPIVSDNIDTNPVVTNDSPVGGFPLGITTVTWNAADQAGNSVTAMQSVTVRDTTSPIITVLGNNPVVIEDGSTYIDGGASAVDIIEGDITSKIVTTNSVDTSIVGTYTVTYDVTDSSGNFAHATRTVSVVLVDRVPPTTAISLSGTLGLNNIYVSNVSVTLSATDDSSGVNYTKYRLNGGSWIEYKSPFVLSSEGQTNIAYYSTDKANNVEQTKSKTVTIDKTPPEIISNINDIHGYTYINWTWADSRSSDFAYVMVYINGVYKTNVLKGVRYYNATGLLSNTPYKINTKTVDNAGNINQKWVNNTAKTRRY